MNSTQFLHTGIYSIPEAAQLTQVSTWRIRRWLKGYAFRVRTGKHVSPPVWEGQLTPIDNSVALGFMDLLEVRCVNAFLQEGVSWRTLRVAHENAKKLVGSAHPFGTSKFATDGQTVFLKIKEGREPDSLWDMKDIQRVFERVIEPFLRDVEFSDDDVALRWWPLGHGRQVVLDPMRSFGHPIVVKNGVPTAILATAFKVESDAQTVADWYGVSTTEVKDAVDFEAKIAA
jgi:uncharacterized protein (DUF433 family)